MIKIINFFKLLSFCIFLLLNNAQSQVVVGSGDKAWYPHGCYLNKLSFEPGDTIRFHTSVDSSIAFYNITIAKHGVEFDFPWNNIVHISPSLSGIDYGIPSPLDSAFYHGANWPAAYQLVIPSSWEPGIYMVKYPISAGKREMTCFFVLRPNQPGSYSDILFVLPTNTFHAYNNWGGKSLYPFQSSSDIESDIVSFCRALNTFYNLEYNRYAEFFRAWLYQQGGIYIPEFAIQSDIDRIPNLLNQYKLILFVGHDEYWSLNQLKSVQIYLKYGGTVGIFSGNTAWWQIRYENNYSNIVCYRNKLEDPLYGIADSLVTVNFYDDPVFYPENQVTGLSYRKGGYVGNGFRPANQGWVGYNDLYNLDSWFFRYSGLTSDDTLGYRPPRPGYPNDNFGIVGYEVDGCDFTIVNGKPVVTGTDGTPLTYKILGVSSAYYNNLPDRYGVMGMYRTKGGVVI